MEQSLNKFQASKIILLKDWMMNVVLKVSSSVASQVKYIFNCDNFPLLARLFEVSRINTIDPASKKKPLAQMFAFTQYYTQIGMESENLSFFSLKSCNSLAIQHVRMISCLISLYHVNIIIILFLKKHLRSQLRN